MAFPWLAVATGLGAAATAYSGYQAAEAARKSAASARAATAEAKRKAQAELAQMQKDSAATQQRFNLQIEQARAATAQQADAARSSQEQADTAMALTRQRSKLAIHKSQLQAAIARQQGVGSKVTKAKRAKRSTPEHMRTKLSIDSGLGGTASGGSSGTGANYG